MSIRALDALSFDNSYARLPDAFYAKLNPTPFGSPPYLVHANRAAADLIDLDPEQTARPDFAGLFGGSMLAPGMEPLAMLYSGHQFGVYVPQLGDGRAILLGEVKNDRGERWDLHLKGGHDAILTGRGRPCGLAFNHQRVSLLRSHASARHSNDKGALYRRERR